MSDPADDRPLPGEDSRLYRIGVMLLNGYGYNWYRLDNQMRADDLLVRSRASEHLERAAARLRDLEGRYRRKYLPPPTREHPDPDPQHIAAARQFRAVADRILEIDTRLRGAAVPPDDKIWLRQRGELETLQRFELASKRCSGSANAMFSWWPTPRSWPTVSPICPPTPASIPRASNRSIGNSAGWQKH